MATQAQIRDYEIHQTACRLALVPQSTLRHSVALKGSVSAPSSTGVTTYTGPDPRTTAFTTVDTLVWASWQALQVRSSGNDPETGRQGEQRIIGQCPAIDDSYNVIVVSHDDTLVDANGESFKIVSPVVSPDLGFYSFQMTKRR